MKILFENVLLDATITADNASDNYPVANLIDENLTVRYQHLSSVYDTAYFVLDGSTDIDCFFFAYSNSLKVIIRLYDATSTLLKTETIEQTTTFSNIAQAVHFDQTYSVKSIQIDVYGASGTYLGGVGAGVAEEFSNVVAQWDDGIEDNTVVVSSPYGQTSRDKVPSLRVQAWEFVNYTTDRKNEIAEIYYTYGLGAKVWVDPFEEAHSFKTPMYAIISTKPKAVKNGVRWDLNWYFKESK